MASTRSWDEIRREIPLNLGLVAAYRALLEADALLEPLLRAPGRGEPQPQLAQALAAAEVAAKAGEPGLGLYLETLARHLAMIGGRLEVRAVFDVGVVMLLRKPDAKVQSQGAPNRDRPGAYGQRAPARAHPDRGSAGQPRLAKGAREQYASPGARERRG